MKTPAAAPGDPQRMGPHELDYPSPSCARVVVGVGSVNPDCWEESWVAPLEKVLTKIESHISLRGVVFTGADGCFPSELDMGILSISSDPKAWEAFCLRLAKCFHRISRMPWFTVAAAGGACTGAGLELALACQARIAASDRGVVLGFPEIAFGRIPSFGGTQRMPRIVGFTRSIEWLTTGRVFTPEEAMAAGVLHAAVPGAELAAKALDYAEGRSRPAPPPKSSWFADRTRMGRRRVARRIESEILTVAGSRNPAPRVALAAARDGMDSSLEIGLELEAKAGASLLDLPISQALARVERLRAAARRLSVPTANVKGDWQSGEPWLRSSQVVEIAREDCRDSAIFEVARASAVRQGKVPIGIALRGQSVVNRILGIYLAEAGRLLAEGLSIGEIDNLATNAGMPMGPFALMDGVGLRKVLDTMRGLQSAHGPRFHWGDALNWLLDAGRDGGEMNGFFGSDGTVDNRVPQIVGIEWAGAERGPAPDSLRAEAEDRLFLSMAAEGSRAVAEKAIDSADSLDIAAIFGFGYPAFRGGPLRDLIVRGDAGRATLAGLAAKHGDPFRVPVILDKSAT